MPRQSPNSAGSPDADMDGGQTSPLAGGDPDGRKKKHTCPTCTRGFTTSGHLSRHQRVHTGERNHACPFPGCTTRCSRQDNLQQHYRVHLSPRSRNISTSAARQAMAKKQNEMTSGIIDTGTTTPPPMPDDSGRASPPAPASLAYRAQQLQDDRIRDASPPHPPHPVGANMQRPAGPVAQQQQQQYAGYPPRAAADSSRVNAPWPSSSQHPYHRDAYARGAPTSPASPHAQHSPQAMDVARTQSHHQRQYSGSSAGSLGSLRDASGSDVSLPSFMESTGPASHGPYGAGAGSSYMHQATAQAHNLRTTSPPPILPPIFTNRSSYGQPLASAAGQHVYHGQHLHGGH